ncbi:MAG: YfdX family protein [Chlorobi bacterium]|nr:YfdX family protein [Chlorobiota bacterium]
MKKIVLLVLTLAFMASCSDGTNNQTQNNQNANLMKAEKIHQDLKQPEKSNISDKQMQEKVAENLRDRTAAQQKADSANIKAALEILAETQKAIDLIAKDKDKEAEDLLAKIVGQLEVLMAKDPNLALIPVDVQYETRDLIADIPSVYAAVESAQKAMDEGYYQLARRILSDLASEIVVKTTYLPLATYPDAIKLSVALMNQGKKKEAAAILVQALNTLLVVDQNIPLPVLRAEEYIKAAALIMESKDENKDQIALNYLANADYQLKLAEALGYGKRDKEYKELADAIEVLQKAIKDKKETKSLFDNLKQKIEKFKIRLFYNKK